MKNVSLRLHSCFDAVRRVGLRMAVVVLSVGLMSSSANAQLVHPGGWHTQEDLTIIREKIAAGEEPWITGCLLYTSPSPRDLSTSRMPSSA